MHKCQALSWILDIKMNERDPALSTWSLQSHRKKLNKCTTHHFFWIVITGTRTNTECFESIDQGFSLAGKGRDRNQGKLPRERNIWEERLRIRGKFDRKRNRFPGGRNGFCKGLKVGSSLAHCWKQETCDVSPESADRSGGAIEVGRGQCHQTGSEWDPHLL